MKTQGRVTLPIEQGMDDRLRQIMAQVGADAVRNSDGTQLPDIVGQLGAKVYSTRFCARGDEAWALDHLDEHISMYLMSPRTPALEAGPLRIRIMDGYFAEQVTPDLSVDLERWWQVIDRTTGLDVPFEGWAVEGEGAECVVTIAEPQVGHVYTVDFLAHQVWDTTQMYNYLTNGWENDPTRVKEHPYDVAYPATWQHVQDALGSWLDEHPEIDVVRFTTFFYHFTIVFNQHAKERFVDWFGYSAAVSVPAIEDFEARFGYQLRPEDFVDEGYYNSSFRCPKPRFRDWMEYVNETVCDRVARLVSIVHDRGREAMMFLGDNWIGTEPYLDRFATTGLDAVVGSVGSAATCRMISDIPGVRYTEGRFLPYFFPDVFNPDGDPIGEANQSWVQARRAILRHPLDRIGYGGYLSLAANTPGFIDRVSEICQEFRDIHELTGGERPENAPFVVGVLNAWGRTRTWMTHMVAHALYYKSADPYVGVIESLAGLPFEVRWLSFDDIRDGVDPDVRVLINVGSAGTAFSGGEVWASGELQATLRAFVASGGGLIGVGEPTAWAAGGVRLQLADVFGVDIENGWSLSTDRYPRVVNDHFVSADLPEAVNVGLVAPEAVATDEHTSVLRIAAGAVQLAVNEYGQGRAVYIAGLPYSVENARLLQRALWWAAGREADLAASGLADDPAVEVAVFAGRGLMAANVTMDPVSTTVRLGSQAWDIELPAGGSRWISLADNN